MPSLSGYRATSALRTAARQFASDLRAAQENAIDQSAQVSVVFTTSGGAVTGYTVQKGATLLYQVALPSQVHATSSWPGGTVTFTATGSVGGPGSTPALCLDNRSGATITAGITLATGRVQLTTGTGGC
jgi:type II secretory pathway pseudopilin PulG